MKMLILILMVALAAPLAAQYGEDTRSLKDYTCWSLLTEPEEYQGSAEVFYLGYALGKTGRELQSEAAYKQVVADVLKRCQSEPDLRVLDAFEKALN
jgi:hypothetical protein